MEVTMMRRIARRVSTSGIGLLSVICLSTSTVNAQSAVQITNWDGTVIS
jgi:hypothetical protein